MNIKELIKIRRFQVIVHSYIYYDLGDNLISDTQWSNWAKELFELQRDYPDESNTVKEFKKDFFDFNFSTGCNLPYRNPQCVEIGKRLVNTDMLLTEYSNDELVKKYGSSKSSLRYLDLLLQEYKIFTEYK